MHLPLFEKNQRYLEDLFYNVLNEKGNEKITFTREERMEIIKTASMLTISEMQEQQIKILTQIERCVDYLSEKYTP
jgi:phosphopantetheine adenylyltransferase